VLGTVHVIDSTYWHEWEVFGLPGGIELFLLESLILVIPFFFGLSRLARGARSGPLFGIVLSGISIAGCGLHAFLLLRGGTEFRNVASISTLVLMLEFSIGLLFGSIRLKRAGLVESNSVEREGWK
jgi:hypothetical protein